MYNQPQNYFAHDLNMQYNQSKNNFAYGGNRQDKQPPIDFAYGHNMQVTQNCNYPWMYGNLPNSNSQIVQEQQLADYNTNAECKSDQDLSSKLREKRYCYTNEQLMVLENEFSKDEYITAERKIELAEKLNVTKRQMTVWFQNRRAKQKREREMQRDQSANDHVLPKSDCSNSPGSSNPSQYHTIPNRDSNYNQQMICPNKSYANYSSHYPSYNYCNHFVGPIPRYLENHEGLPASDAPSCDSLFNNDFKFSEL